MSSKPPKPSVPRRASSSTPHYQTFPTRPPASRGKPPTHSPPRNNNATNNHNNHNNNNTTSPHRSGSHSSHPDQESPLPKKQLAVLAIIALAEQTALNSISPYLPDMASSFPEVKEAQVGLYVGLIASSFALAQFTTNFFWGWLSDRIGRKPVVLIGTILTAACFVAFGCCRTLWQAVVVQVMMGLVNGNQAVISTCLGEITDRSNQSRAFTYLPVVYGIGGITGPMVGGLLVNREGGLIRGYPYLAPNLLSASVLVVDAVITMIWLEESLEGSKEWKPLGQRVESFFARVWQFGSGATRPTYISRTASGSVRRDAIEEEDEEDDVSGSESEHGGLFPAAGHGAVKIKDVLSKDVCFILATFLIFQLSNIAYNSLYPIFAQAKPPTGRALTPEEIGISLAFAGLITIVFQVGIYGRLRDKIGNITTYRIGLGGFVVAFLLMPFVAYKNADESDATKGKVLLWVELAVVLTIKTVAAVGGLTSALLLVRNPLSTSTTSINQHNHNRSQTPPQTTPSSARSTASRKPSRRPAAPQDLSSPAASSP